MAKDKELPKTVPLEFNFNLKYKFWPEELAKIGKNGGKTMVLDHFRHELQHVSEAWDNFWAEFKPS